MRLEAARREDPRQVVVEAAALRDGRRRDVGAVGDRQQRVGEARDVHRRGVGAAVAVLAAQPEVEVVHRVRDQVVDRVANDRHERHVGEAVVEHPAPRKLGEVAVLGGDEVVAVLGHPLRHARPEPLRQRAQPGQAPAHLGGLGLCVALLRKEVAHRRAARLARVLQPDEPTRLVDEALASLLVALLEAAEARLWREAER